MSAKPNICLIGLGLIGGSIGRGLKQNNLSANISGYARSEATRARALELGFVDNVYETAAAAVAGADIIFLNVPLGAMAGLAEVIAPQLKTGAIVSDVGSAKQCVIDDVAPILVKEARELHLVPAHPIAGTEQTGADSGFAELFAGRWCVLTPPPATPIAAIDTISHLWRGLGAEVALMDAAAHDLVLAMTSHIPHLVAYNLVGVAAGLEKELGGNNAGGKEGGDVVRYSAGGFRDFTRITSSDPEMWRDIFLRNKQAILELLTKFSGELKTLETEIRNDDAEAIYARLISARDMRGRIVEAGQEIDIPNFGREKD